ncbi:uncharacterized protein [Spinacia oleracea]|uniref:RNase H type-1 domain-containing protein n=1 Tax=Spinacia oleracea TaxID=3562 RepID=A0ABM3QZR7_SPIOL|nr:uncharacterized protein LOC130463632 [Spinacia oleracea]
MALQEGIIEALKQGITDIQIEGDNLLVINIIKGLCSTPWKLQTVTEDIKKLLCNFSSWKIEHIYREGNAAADWIANVGHLISDSMYFDPVCSPQLLSIIHRDKLGIPLERRAS